VPGAGIDRRGRTGLRTGPRYVATLIPPAAKSGTIHVARSRPPHHVRRYPVLRRHLVLPALVALGPVQRYKRRVPDDPQGSRPLPDTARRQKLPHVHRRDRPDAPPAPEQPPDGTPEPGAHAVERPARRGAGALELGGRPGIRVRVLGRRARCIGRGPARDGVFPPLPLPAGAGPLPALQLRPLPPALPAVNGTEG
jgi:hypothetical protein